MATMGCSADVRDSSKDTHAGAGSGDMYCCWASTNTQQQNGRHPPHIFFAAWESLPLSFKQKHLRLPDTFLFSWYVWYGWCGIFSVWLMWLKCITELSCLRPSEISCLSEEFRNLSGYLSAFKSVCVSLYLNVSVHWFPQVGIKQPRVFTSPPPPFQTLNAPPLPLSLSVSNWALCLPPSPFKSRFICILPPCAGQLPSCTVQN